MMALGVALFLAVLVSKPVLNLRYILTVSAQCNRGEIIDQSINFLYPQIYRVALECLYLRANYTNS